MEAGYDGIYVGYIGIYKNGKGKLYHNSGAVLDGEWVNGSDFHGSGKITLPDGKIFKGEFINNKLIEENGYGIEYSKSDIYVGQF